MTTIDVTLVCVSCVERQRTEAAIRHCMDLVKFGGGAFWFTDLVRSDDYCDVVPAKISSIENYDRFMLHHLPLYRSMFRTSHILVVQPDGFVVKPDAWHPTMLEFDFVGARRGAGDVGNGGFSLRSMKLLDCLHQLSHEIWHRPRLRSAEDMVISVEQRPRLEQLGCCFATHDWADRFSQEHWPDRPRAYAGSFGVHGPSQIRQAALAGCQLPKCWC